MQTSTESTYSPSRDEEIYIRLGNVPVSRLRDLVNWGNAKGFQVEDLVPWGFQPQQISDVATDSNSSGSTPTTSPSESVTAAKQKPSEAQPSTEIAPDEPPKQEVKAINEPTAEAPAVAAPITSNSAEPLSEPNETAEVLALKKNVPVAQATDTQTPVAQAPVAQAPVAQAPVAQAPVAQAPVAQAPVAQAPVAQAPVAQAPVAQAPVAQAPVAQAPEEQVSTTQHPAEQVSNVATRGSQTTASADSVREIAKTNSVDRNEAERVAPITRPAAIQKPKPAPTKLASATPTIHEAPKGVAPLQPSVSMPRPATSLGESGTDVDDYVRQLEQLVIELNYELASVVADKSSNSDHPNSWLLQRMLNLSLQNLALKSELRQSTKLNETT